MKMDYDLADLLYLMRRLRDRDNGCPWDIEQTFASIAPHTLEEAYEVVDCIERKDFVHLKEELGDLLFQVIYHSQMAAEQNLFHFEEVVDALVDKLVARHPHVFPNGDLRTAFDAGASDPARVREEWEARKAREREAKAGSSDTSLLADVPRGLPALTRAQKVQKRAARVGFDWLEAEDVLAKLEEEIAEVRQALAEGDHGSVADEVGDLLFTCVNLSRHMGVDAETAGRQAATKFEHRFRLMEKLIAEEGREWKQLDVEQMNLFWERTK